MKELNINDISVYQTVNNISLFKGDKIIYVLTQERALNALNNQETGFENIKLLVIDEIQNVEKVSNEDEERAKTLFDCLVSLMIRATGYQGVVKVLEGHSDSIIV